jgi:hypothetical protein
MWGLYTNIFSTGKHRLSLSCVRRHRRGGLPGGRLAGRLAVRLCCRLYILGLDIPPCRHRGLYNRLVPHRHFQRIFCGHIAYVLVHHPQIPIAASWCLWWPYLAPQPAVGWQAAWRSRSRPYLVCWWVGQNYVFDVSCTIHLCFLNGGVKNNVIPNTGSCWSKYCASDSFLLLRSCTILRLCFEMNTYACSNFFNMQYCIAFHFCTFCMWWLHTCWIVRRGKEPFCPLLRNLVSHKMAFSWGISNYFPGKKFEDF